MTLNFNYTSPVGILLITTEDANIASIRFLDEKPDDVQSLETPLIKSCRQQLDEYFSGDRKKFELPVLQKGTEFQNRVWEKLASIPYGRTISYLQLSQLLGDPKCIRAAGTANGKNNLPVIIPCHRVIGSNGKLTGFSGGLWRKQWLLEHERKHTSNPHLLF